MNSQDKRTFRRRNLVYYLKIYDRTNGELLGHLADITTEGIMIVAENPMEPNRTFSMELMLPADMEGKEKIQFKAVSRWCDKDLNPDYYDIGFKFTEISLIDRNAIENLIIDFILPD